MRKIGELAQALSEGSVDQPAFDRGKPGADQMIRRERGGGLLSRSTRIRRVPWPMRPMLLRKGEPRAGPLRRDPDGAEGSVRCCWRDRHREDRSCWLM